MNLPMLRVPYFKQDTTHSCGAATLQMVFKFYGKTHSESDLAEKLGTKKDFGTSHQAMIDLARSENFMVYETNKATVGEIKDLVLKGIPVIVNFIEPSNDDGHYAVVVGIDDQRVVLNDPWNGKGFKMHISDFKKRWINGFGTSKQWLMTLRPKFEVAEVSIWQRIANWFARKVFNS